MMDTKTMGWLQLIAGLLSAWFAWNGNWQYAFWVLGAIMAIMGWHHIEGKGHKNF